MKIAKMNFIVILLLMTEIAAAKGVNVNGNGTISDITSGLMWQHITQSTGSLEMNRSDAISYCDNLLLAGKSDWRLPTIKEWLSLYDDRYSSHYDLDPKFGEMRRVWSSSNYIDGDKGIVMNFWFGRYEIQLLSETNWVRCVRTEHKSF